MGKKRKKKKVSVTLYNGNYNIAILVGFPLVLCLFIFNTSNQTINLQAVDQTFIDKLPAGKSFIKKIRSD